MILTNGAFNNGASLTIANGATIERANGTLQTAPTLGGEIDVEYAGAANVTAGVEFPTANFTVRNLILNKTTLYYLIASAASVSVAVKVSGATGGIPMRLLV